MSKEEQQQHITSIGGQAVMEGVMMRGPKEIATAVRKSNGEIIIDKKEVSSVFTKYKFLKIPILRGVISFFESMITGVKCLMFSAEQADLEDGEDYKPSKFEQWLDDKFGDKVKDIVIYFSVFVSLIFSVGLFILLPTVLVGWLKKFIVSAPVLSLCEGGVRIVIFLAYLFLVSRMKDIQRVFEYHGAEHKCINCIEHGMTLTVDHVRESSKQHKRCGTSFLIIVMLISILFFMVVRVDNVLLRMASRIILVPVIAGVSYEFLRLAGRSDNPVVNLLSKPGLWMQNLTTSEPDDCMIEVAIAAVEAVFDWKAYLRENFPDTEIPEEETR